MRVAFFLIVAGFIGLYPSYVQARDAEALALLKELKVQQDALNQKIAAIEAQLQPSPQPTSARHEQIASVTPARAVTEEVAAHVEPAAGETGEADGKSSFIQFKGANTELKLGGALRLNGSWNSESEADEDTLGNSGFDLFRIDVNARYNQWELDTQYRWYDYMNTIHHGYVAYNFSPEKRIELGITQAPFGLLPYASHSFWFSQGYYLGLEDDYDMGVKYHQDSGPWVFDAAFFKNEEKNNASSSDRYSFDVVRAGAQQNEEANQVNLRVARRFEFKKDLKLETGLSGAWGQLYNRTTKDHGDHWRAAAHMDLDSGPWELQLQGTHYDYNPENPAGVDNDTILLGAFADTELVAAEGSLFNANIARKFDMGAHKNIDSLTCYNDYSYLVKHGGGNMPDSQMNVLGCSIGIGPVYTYIDWIAGKNAPFVGTSNALGPSSDTDWNSRFNVNIGWYF